MSLTGSEPELIGSQLELENDDISEGPDMISLR